MSVFVIRRVMQSIIVVVVMSVIVFFGVNVIGDPIDTLISPDADQADVEAQGAHAGVAVPKCTTEPN